MYNVIGKADFVLSYSLGKQLQFFQHPTPPKSAWLKVAEKKAGGDTMGHFRVDQMISLSGGFKS